MTPITLMPKVDFFAGTLFSFVRRRAKKEIEPKPEAKKTKEVPSPVLERSSSRVVRDGHDVLDQAAQLLAQYGAQLGSDIGFYQGRIQHLRASNPVKGRLSKKRKVSPEFIQECQILLQDIQKSLGIYLPNDHDPSPPQPRSRSRSQSPLPVLLRFHAGLKDSSPKVSFVEADLPPDLKRSMSKREKGSVSEQQPQLPTTSDLKRTGTNRSLKPKEASPPEAGGEPAVYAEGSSRARRYDKRREYDREDGRYRSSRDQYKREKDYYTSSSRIHRSDSYNYDFYRERDRDRRYRDRYYTDSRERDRYYDSKPKKYRARLSPSPLDEANRERGAEDGGPSASSRRRKGKERRSNREDEMERGEEGEGHPPRVVLDNTPLYDVPPAAGAGVPFQPTILKYPGEGEDQRSYHDKGRQKERARDRERRYRDRDREGKERDRYGEGDYERERGKEREKGKDKDNKRDREWNRDRDKADREYRESHRDRYREDHEYRRRDYTPDRYEHERSRRYDDDKYRSHRSKRRGDDKERRYYEGRHPYGDRDPNHLGEDEGAGSRFMEVFSPAGGATSSLPRPPETLTRG